MIQEVDGEDGENEDSEADADAGPEDDVDADAGPEDDVDVGVKEEPLTEAKPENGSSKASDDETHHQQDTLMFLTESNLKLNRKASSKETHEENLRAWTSVVPAHQIKLDEDAESKEQLLLWMQSAGTDLAKNLITEASQQRDTLWEEKVESERLRTASDVPSKPKSIPDDLEEELRSLPSNTNHQEDQNEQLPS